jgi:hypothetical protein
MGKYKNPHYKRDWARAWRARPENRIKKTIAGGRPSRAIKEKLLQGQCRVCRTIYEATTENFVLIKNRAKGWQGLSSECRICRNVRWRQHYTAPAWADQSKIRVIYEIADFLTRKTGIKYEVDHYFPIKGKTSCGLHVPGNLRVIPARVNRAKGNREP